MREAEVYRTAFEKEKELTDPALKLAEVGKSKSNWEFREVLGLSVSSPKNQEYLIIKLPVPDPIFSSGCGLYVSTDEEGWKNSLLSAPRGLSPLLHRNSISWA
jgi:hypothetical protein